MYGSGQCLICAKAQPLRFPALGAEAMPSSIASASASLSLDGSYFLIRVPPTTRSNWRQ